MRSGKYRQAHNLYAYIVQHNPSEPMPYVLLGDAYALVMMGHETEGVAQYAQAMKVRPAVGSLVAGDGATFLRNGQLHAARQVYALLGDTPLNGRPGRSSMARPWSGPTGIWAAI